MLKMEQHVLLLKAKVEILNNLKLLYAEDDLETQIIYKEIFNNYFNLVDTSNDGRQALELLRKNYYDLVILDITMPYIDGLELASIIKKINKGTKIIILSAHSDKDTLIRAIKIQVDDYLIKPLNIKDLNECLNKFKTNYFNNQNIYFKNEIVWNKISKKMNYKNKEILLTKKEILLLDLLSTDVNKIFDKDIILNYIWDDDSFENDKNNNLSKLISRFKKKIYDNCGNNIEIIQNCYALGYKLNYKN